jgi:hypothetical protein
MKKRCVVRSVIVGLTFTVRPIYLALEVHFNAHNETPLGSRCFSCSAAYVLRGGGGRR